MRKLNHNIVILGPHGSGNRLIMRLADHAFPGPPGSHAIRSLPVPKFNSSTSLLDWADYYLIALRETSPWAQVRSKHAIRRHSNGVIDPVATLAAAKDQWMIAYKQIYIALGPFWERPDVRLIRYRGIIDDGPEYAINLMSEMLGTSTKGPYGENCDCCVGDDITDGDLKYDDVKKFLSEKEWIDLLKKVTEPPTEGR